MHSVPHSPHPVQDNDSEHIDSVKEGLDFDYISQSAKCIWMPLFPVELLLNDCVRMMSFEERGVYITLLCKIWIDGSIPDDQEYLARLLRIPIDQFVKIWSNISECFMPADQYPGNLQMKWGAKNAAT